MKVIRVDSVSRHIHLTLHRHREKVEAHRAETDDAIQKSFKQRIGGAFSGSLRYACDDAEKALFMQ